MSATVRALIGYPWRHNSSASFAVLLDDQRNGDIGSPRVAGSTSRSNSFTSPGSCSAFDFLPPPALRTRSGGSSLPSSSRTARSDPPALPDRQAVPILSPARDLVPPSTFSRRRPFARAPAEAHCPPVPERPCAVWFGSTQWPAPTLRFLHDPETAHPPLPPTAAAVHSDTDSEEHVLHPIRNRRPRPYHIFFRPECPAYSCPVTKREECRSFNCRFSRPG